MSDVMEQTAGRREKPSRPPRSLWGLPAALAAVLLLSTLGVWQYERRSLWRELQLETDLMCQHLSGQIGRAFLDRTRPLRQLRNAMLAGRVASTAQFEIAARSIQEVLAIQAVIARANPAGEIDAVSPADAQTAELARAVADAGDAAEWCSESAFDDEGPFVLIVLRLKGGVAPGSDGAIVAKMRILEIVEPMLGALRQHYRVVLHDAAGNEIGAFPRTLGDSPYTRRRPVQLFGREWAVTLEAQRSFLDTRRNAANWLLVAGLLLSIVAPAAVGQVLLRRWREVNLARAHVEDLAHLAEASFNLNSLLGTGGDLLQPVLEAAHGLVKLPAGCVTLLEDDGISIRIAADHRMDPPALGLRFGPDSAVTVTRCIRTGEMFSTEDTLRETAPLNPEVLERFHIRSMIVIPLVVEEKRLGAMVLCDRVPRRFSERELHLARLWGAQASAMLANQKMWRQTADALAGQKKLLEQREMLYAIYHRLYDTDNSDEAIQALTDMAPAPLQVDVIGVSLLEEDGVHLCMRAFTKTVGDPAVLGHRYPLKGTFAEIAMSRGRVCCSEDAQKTSEMESRLREQLRVGSIMMVPLIGTDGQMLGVMGCIRHRAGTFSQEQIELAGVFGGRVAQAIQLTSLLRQTQRDAETRATLLHELNHRVNNNLAAIIGLLSFNQPPLPTEAEQWLERVIARIATVARTQLMFQGGQHRASISQIVEQVLSSLSVARRPGVIVQTQLGSLDVELDTNEAVPLAMVLHELCLNALKYGIGERGVLTIRGSIVQDSVIEIEVIDDGSALDSGKGHIEPVADRRSHAARVSGGGTGLQLVRELVRRELKGEFLLERSDCGGAKAVVRFRNGCVRREISSPRAD